MTRIVTIDEAIAAEEYFHAQDADMPPSNFVPTDFHKVCLCHREIIGGVEYMAHSPSCEMDGHGCQTRFISECATSSASVGGEGRRGKPCGHEGSRLKKGAVSYWCKQGHCKFCAALNCGHDCHKENR